MPELYSLEVSSGRFFVCYDESTLKPIFSRDKNMVGVFELSEALYYEKWLISLGHKVERKLMAENTKTMGEVLFGQ